MMKLHHETVDALVSGESIGGTVGAMSTVVVAGVVSLRWVKQMLPRVPGRGVRTRTFSRHHLQGDVWPVGRKETRNSQSLSSSSMVRSRIKAAY